MPDALPATTLPLYPGYGTGTKNAGLHTQWRGCGKEGQSDKN